MDIQFVKQLLLEKKWNDIILYLEEHSSVKNIFVLTSLYKAHNNLKQYDVMEEYIDRILEIKDNNPTVWKDKGLCYQRRSEWASAVKCFSRAIELAPDISSFYALRAKSSFELNHNTDAITDYKKALKLNPNNVTWLKYLGNILIKNNQISDAVEIYKQILVHDKSFYYQAVYDELENMLKYNTEDITSKYYDKIFTNSEKYLSNPEESIYSPIWLYIAEIIKTNKFKNILDLGCGPGQFAEFLQNRFTQLHYMGVDFSKEAVAIAEQRCPDYIFEKKTLPINNLDKLYDFDIVICTEVLEYVTFDIEILESIPSDVSIICSVPNFDSFGHVRFFKSEEEVRTRYAKYFKNLSIQSFNLSQQNIIWLLYGSK